MQSRLLKRSLSQPSQTQSCDLERIEAYLSGDLHGVGRAEFIAHLNDCHVCRQELEQRAAEPECWREARELLRPETSPSLSDADHDSAFSCLPRLPLLIQQVLNSLAPTDDPAMLGRLGSYEVSSVVGSGGMGVVLKSIDKSLDRIVAIKVHSHPAASGAARKRFAREAKAAAAVLHPNVIAIHGVANDSPLPYLVMAYVRGTSLQTHNGKPIVDVALLQSHFPAVPDGKQAGKVVDGETTIVFVDVAMIGGQIATAASEQAHSGLKVIPPQR